MRDTQREKNISKATDADDREEICFVVAKYQSYFRKLIFRSSRNDL